MGCCRGSESEEADGITAHDRGRRDRAHHGAVGRVGRVPLAHVLGLARAHRPFSPPAAEAQPGKAGRLIEAS